MLQGASFGQSNSALNTCNDLMLEMQVNAAEFIIHLISSKFTLLSFPKVGSTKE